MLLTYHFLQTLTTLDISYNSIGSEGVQYLANALQQNQVFIFLIPHTLSIIHCITQALITLNLIEASISEQGAQHLASALQKNEV